MDVHLVTLIAVMPQGALYVFADASRWTDDSYAFAFELFEKAGVDQAPWQSRAGPARREHLLSTTVPKFHFGIL